MNASIWRKTKKNWVLYLFLLPAVIYAVCFMYAPMGGVLIAFKNYQPRAGILGSAWTANYGFFHFIRFFRMHNFLQIVENTLTVSLYSLILFPLPIILALLMHVSESKTVKSVAQHVTYAPHFISTVVLVGMINIIFAPRTGLIANILLRSGIVKGYLNVLTNADAFKHLYVWSGVWQGTGWGSIIYLAALSGVDRELHEAAMIDGASRLRRVFYVDLPCVMPTIVICFILRMGSVMSVGYEKVYLMQNALNLTTSEVISTYVYKQGLLESQYSFSTAVGLVNSVLNIILLLTFNFISKKFTETSLF